MGIIGFFISSFRKNEKESAGFQKYGIIEEKPVHETGII